MLDHFGNFTEINPPSPQEFELCLRQQACAQAHAALKDILENRKPAAQGRTWRSLLDRIIQLFGAPTLF